MQAVTDQVIPDEELVEETRSGRTGAYAELARRWSPRLLALCHAKVGRSGVAEDLAQETLLRGFRSIGTLAEPAKFGAWLHGIALRACLDWLKAKERSTVTFSALIDERSPDEVFGRGARAEEPELDRRDEMERLLLQVEALPEEYREVVMLFYYQELKYRDIAEVLGISAATVNARLTKARALLRQRLERPRR
jgi:RNA polymerase sigma-70 factor (ECF subfamily)